MSAYFLCAMPLDLPCNFFFITFIEPYFSLDKGPSYLEKLRFLNTVLKISIQEMDKTKL